MHCSCRSLHWDVNTSPLPYTPWHVHTRLESLILKCAPVTCAVDGFILFSDGRGGAASHPSAEHVKNDNDPFCHCTSSHHTRQNVSSIFIDPQQVELAAELAARIRIRLSSHVASVRARLLDPRSLRVVALDKRNEIVKPP